MFIRILLEILDVSNNCCYPNVGLKQGFKEPMVTKEFVSSYLCKTAVLNRLRLTDHLVNFVSGRGPPLKIDPLVHCG